MASLFLKFYYFVVVVAVVFVVVVAGEVCVDDE